MNMTGDLSAMDAIVLVATAFVLVFVVAWMISPSLRNRIERPKHRFQKHVQSYDQTAWAASQERNRLQ